MISIEDFDRNEIFKMLGNTGIEKKNVEKASIMPHLPIHFLCKLVLYGSNQ